MLHTNYQYHRLFGSGEDFESILTIFGLSCDPDCLSKQLFSQSQETTRNLAQRLLRIGEYETVIF